jgi:S-formylglutathione hydrolase FrmB
MFKLSTVVLFLLLLTPPAHAAGRVECGSVTSRYMPDPVAYCALLPPSYDGQPGHRFPVLYYLHGLGGDESFLVSGGGWNVIEDAQEQKQISEFVTITPQADSSFYINSKNGRVRYEDFFVRDFIPQMEKHFRLLSGREARAIGGISMGGYGALRFAFKDPRMFVAVVAHMPALLERLPPGSSQAGLAPYLGSAFGRPLDEAYWNVNTPFVFAQNSNLHGLKIYFDCGDEDDFGFDTGTRDLDKLLTGRHVPHIAHIYPGRHNWQFVARHMDDSLKFISDAFKKANSN